ncbi:ribokinase [Sansalvadorimonas sp. 2012CJ34-2]|uniref:Ribokinase n=1 Tax=Parendozoicomonas callyspongiae TaxID=2942213 RepID=A0ABT0PHY8_9GAMM|nr:ribokinase [Sansalvadorimonas sp. 2012CJ34-2]MCL6270876.1 ribokinase [Sansalvadorimonas sp. 2012CJ34-2]
MAGNKIIVLGSVNADHVIQTPKLPRPGETVAGTSYQVIPGGKGANQAVACALISKEASNTAFIACVGEDSFGRENTASMAAMGMDTSAVNAVTGKATGVALISVDQNAENCITIAPEANACLDESVVQKHKDLIASGHTLLMQLETPLKGLTSAAKIAKESGTRVVLNPAPARPLPDSLLANLDMITPNQTEAELLTGIPVSDEDSAQKAAEDLHKHGISTVVITMGKHGAWISENDAMHLISGFKVTPVDTTAAGDTFNGALVVALAEGKPLEKAVTFANAAGAISVTRPGAQPSVPTRQEVDDYLAKSS